MNRVADAKLCLLCMYAEDAYEGPGRPIGAGVPYDHRVGHDWTVAGYLSGQDAVLDDGPLKISAGRVWYGWLLKGAQGYAIVIRGTNGFDEWAIDGEFCPVAYPHGGAVEAGFYTLYQSMRAVPPAGGVETDPIPWLCGQIGDAPVTVVGHSLGTALATYLGADLARNGLKVSARLFAPPHPGDEQFCQEFAKLVPDHLAYRYSLDVVPRVPLWLGYRSVPNLVTLEPDQAPVKVRFSVGCNHHAGCYACLLDPTSAREFTDRDTGALACLTFPSLPHE